MVALLADIPRVDYPSAYPAPAGGPALQDPVVGRRRPSPAVLLRRRLFAVVLLVLLVAVAWFGLQAALGRIGGSPLATTGAPGGVEPVSTRVWIVRPGDTLWTIAKAVDPRGDVRPLVDRLARELHGTVLYPGETVALPAR